mmetsp:Transcript_1056/g.1891  ORF Transcript_1056/g.1891 Transcript_1056/m.1891 type:complete len:678 (+) Transcript_1056:89-2122(+)
MEHHCSIDISRQVVRPKLREISRRRLLDEMIHQVLKNGQLYRGPEEDQQEEPPKYVVLLLDAETRQMVNTACKVHELIDQGVCLVENVHNERQALPVLDALYFLQPSEENIDKIVEDAVASSYCTKAGGNLGDGEEEDADAGKRKRSKYRNLHIFFTHQLPEELLDKLARQKRAASRIRSFAEVNLSFIAHDERIFHFADEAMFSHIVAGSALNHLNGAANRLATVCASLGALQANIRYPARRGDGAVSMAESLAGLLKGRLDEIASKGPMFQREEPEDDPGVVIIIDRAHDWPAMLIHDLHYENAIYDLLGGASASVRDKTFKHDDRGVEKVYSLVDDKEELWAQFKHQAVWHVQDDVGQEVKRWAQRDEEMKSRTAHATGSNSMASMASKAMNALQSLPEHKELFAKLQVHSDICHKCFDTMEDQKLIDVASFEQELLTGVDASGRDLLSRKIEKELDNFLADPDISAKTKYRLMLLYLASQEEGARDEDKRQGFARRLRRDEKEAALSQLWRNTAVGPPETSEQAFKRRALYRERAMGRSLSPRSARLSRFRPKVLDILEQATAGELSRAEFPEFGKESEPAPKKRAAQKPETPGQVILFILGGLTMLEGRIAHGVAKASGVDVFIGGSSVITASTLTEELVKKGQDAAAAAAAAEAAEAEAEADEGTSGGIFF